MPPPLTLTRSGSAPVSAIQASTTEANASLTSNASKSSIRIPVLRSAYSVAGIGALSMKMGSAPRTLRWWMRARGVRSCAFTAASEATRTALAPSEIWLASAAVRVPPARRVGNFAIASRLVSRGHSSMVKSPTGTVSLANRPSAIAACARS